MASFNFERNLPHQQNAVDAVLKVFNGAGAIPLLDKAQASISNPNIEIDNYKSNISQLQDDNGINTKHIRPDSNILDISMETGTGKTYTYTKMIFELNKALKLSKFIIIVPTLSIKAGTVNFLTSKATKEHFRQEYKDKDIKTYIVESKKAKKGKKNVMPQAIREFVEVRSGTNANNIHILIINAGMINSDTMTKAFDVSLFDKYSNPFEAIQSIQPITIVDEPHKFAKQNKTWQNIEKLKSQYVVRYGATFNNKYENLLYQLTAINAFNDNLVKGVIACVQQFEAGENCSVTLTNIEGTEARFRLNTNGQITIHRLSIKDSLEIIHEAMQGLFIENLNRSTVVLSNGLELKRSDKINPYSYAQSMQQQMMQQAIAKHFEIEKKLLTREVKIKPLTLFFIDDIASWRDQDGQLRTYFETITKAHIKKLLKTETNAFYKEYLQKSLRDISGISGGYFSKDNSSKDEKIEKEINEILHDKETLLSLDNPRRFIFSKWTLREGWDNPNVFQICKLRSSGSVTSKLQEVGRGLRLPVNEYMARVKDEQFDLHYYVDFTENGFVNELINEINQNSNNDWMDKAPKLTQAMIDDIVKIYGVNEEVLLTKLDGLEVITRNNDFKEGGYQKLQNLYPVSNELNRDKIRNKNTTPKLKTTIRKDKYKELQELWEVINQKVVLEYNIKKEEGFLKLLKDYFKNNLEEFKPQGARLNNQQVVINQNSIAHYQDLETTNNELLSIATMSYKEFLIALATKININIQTIHTVFLDLKSESKFNINDYMNEQTIRIIKNGFNKYLLNNTLNNSHIEYQRISNIIHPTKFTNKDGVALKEINASDIGVHQDVGNEAIPDSYLFEELFYDSNLEKNNILLENIDTITVFTKIPKNSIKIPVVGGFSYSPDFAYVVKDTQGNKSLNLIVETKDKNKEDLTIDEKTKIEHARQFFFKVFNEKIKDTNKEIKVNFETQFRRKKIVDIIEDIIKKEKAGN